ncbi:hypothetical protein ACFQ2B_05775 [Streptomyces stramineus]
MKGNFGHLDCMAGFAGLVRVIAQFRAGEIFPTAHFTAPNPCWAWTAGRCASPTGASRGRPARPRGAPR